MQDYCPAAETELDAWAEATLLAAFERMAGKTAAKLSLRFFTPRSARTKRRRRFGVLAAAGRPILVCKVPLDPDDQKVAGEWAKLATLSLHPCVRHPKPIERTGGGFIMTYAPAVDLPDAVTGPDQPERVSALLRELISLLAALHSYGPSAVMRGCGLQVARHYTTAAELLEGPFRVALQLARIGPTHGDLAPWNVRYDLQTRQFSIIDWEDFRPIGVPGIDVLNLVITLGIAIFPEARANGFDWLYERVMLGNHWYALLLRDAITRYASLTKQPARFIADLLPFFCLWMIERIESEGRDSSIFYYSHFKTRYIARAPDWITGFSDV